MLYNLAINLSKLLASTSLSYAFWTMRFPPLPLIVPSFDNGIRLLLWFVTNTSHNCPGLSYTNKQTDRTLIDVIAKNMFLHTNKW